MSKQKRRHGALEPTAPKIPEHPFQKRSKSAARKGLCRNGQNLRDFAFLNHLFPERLICEFPTAVPEGDRPAWQSRASPFPPEITRITPVTLPSDSKGVTLDRTRGAVVQSEVPTQITPVQPKRPAIVTPLLRAAEGNTSPFNNADQRYIRRSE
jgi:hypothetical protein